MSHILLRGLACLSKRKLLASLELRFLPYALIFMVLCILIHWQAPRKVRSLVSLLYSSLIASRSFALVQKSISKILTQTA